MSTHSRTPVSIDHSATLRSVEQRVLWLATAIVDHANRVRQDPSGLKVGGHQASSASMVSIMTALWFARLTAQDRVSVKPHASPVLHAINFLLGELPADKLTSLRDLGGLQSYPSRSKDPDPVDYSTGSVGLGATAPAWGAVARRYAASHGGPLEPGGRQYALIGDAELDEGAVWETLMDPSVLHLGELVWVVDFNRQSLDRVINGVSSTRLLAMFDAAGWQVLSVKYGQLLTALFERPGGAALRHRIDTMENPEYQRLLRCGAAELRRRLPGGSEEIAALVDQLDDTQLKAAIANLGGHDLDSLIGAFDAVDDTRPTVIFAYTVKGFGLPTAGHPQNHSALLSEIEMQALAERSGVDLAEPWQAFDGATSEGNLCSATASRLKRPSLPVAPSLTVPRDLGRTSRSTGSTQQALGRLLMDLSRTSPEVADRIVTVAPDVTSSTNLAGWLNKVGAWSPDQSVDWFEDDRETMIRWASGTQGQHIELGIAEINLVSLLAELGSTWSRWNLPLIPIGVVYDVFLARALEPWSFGMYSGGQSILVGTPSGVTLAPEGGAHQSISTPSIGLEQPGCVSFEPAFVIDTEWCLLDAMSRVGRPGGSSSYLRLSTKQVDQSLADIPPDPASRERRRRQVVAGAYRLRAHERADVTIAAMGAMVPETVAAADLLAEQGIAAEVVCVTSPDLLYRAVRARQGLTTAESWVLDQVFPADRASPMVTVVDGHPHTLAFLSSICCVPSVNLGVDSFGQSSTLADAYELHGIDAASIVRGALTVLGR